MKHKIRLSIFLLTAFTSVVFGFTVLRRDEIAIAKDPLPSWNEGASKRSIIDFVTRATNKGSADFVPVADRIACFDNDGTLWAEQPVYFQFAFARYKNHSCLHTY